MESLSCHLMYQQHRTIDAADVFTLAQNVKERLHPYSDDCTALTFEEEQLKILEKQQEMQQKFEELKHLVNKLQAWMTNHTKIRLEAVQKCSDECSDIQSFGKEVQEAFKFGELSLVRDLAVGMQAHVGEIEAAFSRSARLREESREIVVDVDQRLERLLDILSKDLNGTSSLTCRENLRPEVWETSETSVTASVQISYDHEIELDGRANWVTVCSDSSEFRSDHSGRVVPANSVGDEDSAALPQPCFVAKISGENHLTVMSMDGTVRLRSHCVGIDWNNINGLYGDGHLLYISQLMALTVTDLSGRTIRRILPDTAGFYCFRGICGNAASVFVSSGNKIAAFSKATGQLDTVITLQQIPDADLQSMAINENCILVADCKHNKVHRVRSDTQQVVATYPTEYSELALFDVPRGVAVDSRGRLFASEFRGHAVRAVAANDGSLLWRLGTPGESGSGVDRLSGPCGLAVVTAGAREQLVVSDFYNQRFVVMNLH